MHLVQENAVVLESLIDSVGLSALLEDIAAICWEKGEHLRANWQDNSLAGLWDDAGKAVDKVSAKVQV